VSPIAARRASRVPSREELVQKAKDRLLRHGLPRFQMSIVLALTGATGFLASFGLLKLGVGSMTLRYPVAVALAYGSFLLLLRLWLKMQRDGWGDVADLGMNVLENADFPVDSGAPVGGGGGFGGAGSTSDFEAPKMPLKAAAPKGGGGGKGFDLSFDLDDGAFLVLLAVAIVAVAALGAALWILWIAPALLAEVLVDGLVMTALYRRLRQPQPTWWLTGAVRRTWIPALVVALLLAVAGALLHRAVPEARSIGAAWKAVSAERNKAP
jgi:hypothetical protein